MAAKATSSGDLEGLLLTGLDSSGFSLLGSYVDRTGDVQTAALASAFVHPGQTYDIRAERWIEAYRKLLDHWKLYIIRARFDIARGSKMRSSLAVKGTEESSVAIGALLAPPNMAIRCHYCNETVAPRTVHGGANQFNQPVKRRQGVPSQPVPSGRVSGKRWTHLMRGQSLNLDDSATDDPLSELRKVLPALLYLPRVYRSLNDR